MSNPFSGVILAGGRSRRFGSDKWSYILNDKPLVQYPIDLLEHTIGSVIIVASGASQKYLDRYGTVVVDELEDRGPVAALVTAFRHVSAESIFVLPCDMPNLDESGIKLIMERHVESGADATVASSGDGRVQPLVGCYRASSIGTFEQCLNEGDASMHSVLRMLQAVVLVELSERQLVNVNRPTDLP